MRAVWGLTVAVLLASAVPSLAGQTFYVTDELEITLRAGPGLGYKILQLLKTGTPLEKLGEEEGWAHVRAPDGQDGWVVARYLSGEPPKGPQLEAARRELASLRDEAARLRKENASWTAKAREAQARAERLARELESLRKEFSEWKEAHADAVALRTRLQALEKQEAEATAELQRLRAENRTLQVRERFYWFFSGALVLLSGWILGYLYASSRQRAKTRSRFRY